MPLMLQKIKKSKLYVNSFELDIYARKTVLSEERGGVECGCGVGKEKLLKSGSVASENVAEE